MNNLPSHPNPISPQDLDSSIGRDQAAPATPSWVKVFVIAGIVLILLLVILHLTGNGFGNHMHMSIIEYAGQLQ